MKYTLDAALRELTVRSRRLRRKRERRTVITLSAATAVLSAGVLSMMVSVAGQLGQGEETTVFGSFVLPNTAGGYVLAGVIAFALGAVFTMLCVRQQKRITERKTAKSYGDTADAPLTEKEEQQ